MEFYMNTLWTLSYCIFAVCSSIQILALRDNITASQSLRDGETLISKGRSFELGFFSPGSSRDRYLGIWYNNIRVRTVVWVANGGLVLLSGANSIVWLAVSSRIAGDSVVQLLDSGNLVLRESNADVYLWQSFDYPSDTLLPGMKLGWDLRTSLNRRLSSWRNPDDPSSGELSNGIELGAYPQAVMLKGTWKFFRGGPWNGLRFSGAPELKNNPVFDFRFVSNQDEVYYIYELLDRSVLTRLILNETTSSRQRYVWVERDQAWKIYGSVPRDLCDNYGLCGANGICVISDSPVCQCLKGFVPKLAQSWNSMDWSSGCVRDEPLNCTSKHDFIKFSGVKLPDTKYSWVNLSMSLRECREVCLRNCSCMAYTNSDISGKGSGCAIWFGDLVDIRQFSDGGQDLYVRMQASNRAHRSRVIAAAVAVPVLVIGLLVVVYYLCRRAKRSKCTRTGRNDGVHIDVAEEDLDLPLLDFSTVAHATDSFSEKKKLGEGGFGPVYKGTLVDGQNIAVKRLSTSSGQGLNEFKNEVKLIAKLQHRNLVKLLACCIEGEEKILIYEYMPNGSLDSFLFGLYFKISEEFNVFLSKSIKGSVSTIF